jgi:hypothetical protein
VHFLSRQLFDLLSLIYDFHVKWIRTAHGVILTDHIAVKLLKFLLVELGLFDSVLSGM